MGDVEGERDGAQAMQGKAGRAVEWRTAHSHRSSMWKGIFYSRKMHSANVSHAHILIIKVSYRSFCLRWCLYNGYLFFSYSHPVPATERNDLINEIV